jgi:methionine synthase I (cobalamin-dependent)
MDLLAVLQTRVLCGDGAMGTLLIDAGVPLERCFEELCLSEPARIRSIHANYIGAGARVIETNTFGGNAIRLERFGLQEKVGEINRAAARLAREAANGQDVYVAGSVGPLGISAGEAASRGIDRAACFRAQIGALLEGGVELIFFETFTDLEEMEIALRVKIELGDVPEICSFACRPSGRLPSGTALVDAFTKLRELGAKIVGVNCMNDPRGILQLLQQVATESPLAVYPTAGDPKYRAGRFTYDATPDDFAECGRKLIAAGARIIGGCCGTNPTHISAIATVIAENPASR